MMLSLSKQEWIARTIIIITYAMTLTYDAKQMTLRWCVWCDDACDEDVHDDAILKCKGNISQCTQLQTHN